MTDAEAAGATPPEDGAPQRQGTPFLVLQFFIFPMAIVGVCVAVFVVFGMIAAEGKGPRGYLDEVRTGSANRRWQAAFELSRVLQAKKDPTLSDPKFVEEVATLFDESSTDDPRVRRYLALALGRLGDARAAPALLKVVREPRPEADSETLIYSIWALGAIGEPSVVPELRRLAASEDRGIRKSAVHALGSFPGEEASASLIQALSDAAADVRWNAAVALARRRDTRAAPVLLQMLDRGSLSNVQELTEEQREEVVMQAAAAAAFVPDPSLRAALAGLRDRDVNLKVREAARTALEAGKGGAAAP